MRQIKKITYAFIIILMCTYSFCYSQNNFVNIVANPSFTDPDCSGSYNSEVFPPNWMQPNSSCFLMEPGSSDYSCNFGRTDEYSVRCYIRQSSDLEYYEYATGKLNTNMIPQHYYYVEFFVLADESPGTTVGALFTEEKPNQPCQSDGWDPGGIIDNTPQIENPVWNVFYPGDGWVRISGYMVANGEYDWITLGCYRSATECRDFYYFDDIKAIDLGTSCPWERLIEDTYYNDINILLKANHILRAGYDVGAPSDNGNVIVQNSGNTSNPGGGTTSYNCVNSNCDLVSGSGGQYPTYSDCANACAGVVTTYDCISGNCIPISGTGGQYSSLSQCKNACSTNVTYRAGAQIDLMPGFTVEAGANFHAYIAPCDCPQNIADAGNDYTMCGQDPYKLGYPPTESLIYSWSSEPTEAIDYLSNPNISDPVFIPPPNSSGTVVYTLTVSNLCQEDYPAQDEVIVNYTSSPNNSPSISVSNIVLGDYISFDMNYSQSTEEIIIEILDWNGNPLNPARVYTLNVGADFTCCTKHWQIPDYLSACQNYKVRVKSRNVCSDIWDTDVIDWQKTIQTVTLDQFTYFYDPLVRVGCEDLNGLYIMFTGAEAYSLTVYDRWGHIYYTGSGTLTPSDDVIWDGSCNAGTCHGEGSDGSYYYVLTISSPCSNSITANGNMLVIYCDNSGKTDETNDTTATNQQQVLQENEKLLISEGIKIIPNPNNGIFTVQINSFDAESIVVQNMLGHTVYQIQNNSAKNVEIDLRDFSVGVYVVKVQTPSGQIFVEKVVYK